MHTALRTPRLILLSLDYDQLAQCNHDLPALERQLGLSISPTLITDRIQHAIAKKLEKMNIADPDLHSWFTYWLAIFKEQNAGVGLLGFKGAPDERGAVEIGYGIDPAWQNQGFATEAVQGLVRWAFEQQGCASVTATRVQNPASRRVLEKLGARLVEEGPSHSSWKLHKEPGTSVTPAY